MAEAELEVQADFPAKLQPLFRPAPFKVAFGGRGAAKSWGIARALLIIGAERKLRILCTREVQKSIKDSVHKLLSDQIGLLGYDAIYTVLRDEIRGRNGTEFLFAGLSDITAASLKSFEGVDIAWVEEAQGVSKRSWSVLIPTIRKGGSEIWVSFNPELDTDETYVRFVEKTPPGCVLMPMNWRDNPWFSDKQRADKDHLQKTDPESFENVWEGKPRTTIAGAIYKNEIQATVEAKRIRPVPVDPMLKVHTIWDLGWNDQNTIIFAQRVGGELRIVDYLEDSHKTYAEYVQILEAKKYRYGTDFIPHDGRAKNEQTGKSGEETLRALGRNVLITPNVPIEDGIKQARLAFPRCYFDVDRTPRLVECLKRYRRNVPTTTNEPTSPVHDEYSHGADAFRYMALVADKLTNDEETNWKKPLKYDNRGFT